MKQFANEVVSPKQVKKTPYGLEESLNKTANNLRIYGAISIMLSLIAAISYMSEIDDFYNIFGMFLFSFFIVGTVMLIIGERLWRKLLKHSDTVKPIFSLLREQ